MAYFYDRKHGTKKTQPFVPGEQVRIRTDNEKSWQTAGTVTRQVAPRSYIVSTDQGTYRRTAKHIMSDKSAKQSISNTSPTQSAPPQNDSTSQTDAETRSVIDTAPPVATEKSENTVTPVNPIANNPEFPTTRSGRAVKPVNKMNLEIQRINRNWSNVFQIKLGYRINKSECLVYFPGCLQICSTV